MSWPWSELGLPGPSDLSAVRHAYAQRLKTTHPEENPEGFQRLHSAFQAASRMARQTRSGGGQTQTPPPRFHREEAARTRSQEPPREPPREEDPQWDYDALLREGETAQTHGEEQEEPPPEWDYDQLLKEGEAPPPRQEQQEQQRDFDFERLFAEGDAERAQARQSRGQARQSTYERRQQEDRRRQQERQQRQWQESQQRREAYERERRESFARQHTQWQGTETVLHAMELLCHAQAPEEEWQKLLHSPQFQQVQQTLDFIFGLEDFLSVHQDLPQPVRLALFLCYGFDKGVSRPELRPLYQMLLEAWQAEQKKKRAKGVFAVATVAITLGAMLGFGVILSSPLFLGFVILGAVAWHGLSKGWFKRAPKNLNTRGRKGYVLLLGACCAAAGAMFLFPLVTDYLTPEPPDPRQLVCQYLEEDFGEAFQSHYNPGTENANRYSNVFSTAAHTTQRFLAGPDGERDPDTDARGYTTNYTEMKVYWALRELALEQDSSVHLSMTGSDQLETWQTSGTYLLTLPFNGSEEVVRQVGELLEELSRTSWYQQLPPSFRLVLASNAFAEGELAVIYDYTSDTGAFDTREVLRIYEEEFPYRYCAALVRACELDRGLAGTEPVEAMSIQGRMEMQGQSWYWLAGLDEEDNVTIQYFVSPTARDVRCLPGNAMPQAEEVEALPFRNMVHLKQVEGRIPLFVCVYYPR